MNLQKNRASWPGWYGWAAMLASSLIFSIGAVVISLHANANSDRKWCSVVTTMDDSYKEQPPTTPAGQNVARGIAELRGQLGCPPP